MGITDEKVDRYLTQLMPIEDSLLIELQQQGLKDEVPIIQIPSIRLIEVISNIIQPKVIIELGTAIGFSAIWLAKAFPNATIHTIERNSKMIKQAKENIKKAGLTDRITLHEGDAVEILPSLPKVELIFIDAAKGKYKEFFNLAFPLLNVGGIFIFDNILFRGYVADQEICQSKPMLRKIRNFNDFIATHKKVKTSFVPIGDGLAICYKLEE
ncbi:hypothetical protein BHF71_03005 [Vulcanibacillus modesticaldus]|uniref:tRNA 5-hydroxyuridine methyltransferase n=1 Tax=Vulcanibacillus modesticaldus TaxID=337097 RepID=A0A1D2YTA7_9BACI|nr:O-methyltransferase [Vulcanibacillus modesticaldus]OEF98911.1 hypothetical protein BHF71_03005 [Vulcanibacillus modesticaldus]